LGLFRKPNVKSAPAGAEVDFGEDEAFVTWHGDLELLVRGHAVYLDWAVNKDNRSPAIQFLAGVLNFLDNGPSDRLATPDTAAHAWRRSTAAVAPIGKVTIAFTDQMRCKAAFRPRTAILTYLYPTFWALWNQLVVRAGDEPGAIEAFVDDLRTQIDYYDKKGIGMRGGIAPIFAARVGAGTRLSAQIAAFHGLTLDEFRALPEAEQDRLIEEHTEHNLRDAGLLDAGDDGDEDPNDAQT
jgi:hypothetical protein